MVFGKENLLLPRIGSKPSGSIFTFEPDTAIARHILQQKTRPTYQFKIWVGSFHKQINVVKFTIKKLVGQVIT